MNLYCSSVAINPGRIHYVLKTSDWSIPTPCREDWQWLSQHPWEPSICPWRTFFILPLDGIRPWMTIRIPFCTHFANCLTMTATYNKNHAQIYVAIWNYQADTNPSEAGQAARLVSHRRWGILIDPPKQRRLSLSHSAGERTMILIDQDDKTRSWSFHSRPPNREDELSLIGKILVGDSKSASTTAKVQELLRARPVPDPATVHGEGVSEHWVRKVLHTLQDEDLVQKFDVDEFIHFAKSYGRERMTTTEDFAPPAVAYSMVAQHSSDTKQSKSGQNFWLSLPVSDPSSPAQS